MPNADDAAVQVRLYISSLTRSSTPSPSPSPSLSFIWRASYIVAVCFSKMFSLHVLHLRHLDLTAISPWTIAKALSASLVVLLIALLFIVVKRLCFHPLSKVPGPKLAAATGWYEFYYDVIRNGAYSHQYLGFHQRYGESLPKAGQFFVSAFDSAGPW